MANVKSSSRQDSGIFECVTKSVEATEQLGERLGQRLEAGDTVALIGELGSGKTTLIRGIARGLGIDSEVVRSPTFLLMREYPGRLPLIHVDAYRLESSSDVGCVDTAWLFSPNKVTVVEWAERLGAWLPDDYLEVRLAHHTTNQRAIRAIAHGPRSKRLLESLQKESVVPPRSSAGHS